MVICEVVLLVMAYVPTPSHGAPVGVAKATVHIFSNAMGRVTVTLVRPKEQFHTPHCFYQQMARYPKPVKVYRESKTKPVTPTLILLKWLIECHKNVDPFTSYPVEKAQKVPFTASGKVKLTFL